MSNAKAAFASLALTLRKHAHSYKKWAEEAEAKGDLEDYRRWRSQSDKSWRGAKRYLELAMREADHA